VKKESYGLYSDTKVLPAARSHHFWHQFWHQFWTATQSWTVNIHALVNAPDGLK
jgi:hypothetical protein